jgi:hypothetical protein
MGNFLTKPAKWRLFNKKDLFPSRPEPLTSEVTKQPEDESEDWLIE